MIETRGLLLTAAFAVKWSYYVLLLCGLGLCAIMDTQCRFEQYASPSGFQEVYTESDRKPLYRQGEEKQQPQNLSAWIYLLLNVHLIRMQTVTRHTL